MMSKDKQFLELTIPYYQIESDTMKYKQISVLFVFIFVIYIEHNVEDNYLIITKYTVVKVLKYGQHFFLG